MGEESEVDADQTESPEAADDDLSSANGEQSDSTDSEMADGADATAETESAVDDNDSEAANESEESTTVDPEAAATSSEADAQSDGGISPVESESPDEDESLSEDKPSGEDEIIEEAAAAIEDEGEAEAAEAEEAEGASQTDAGTDIQAPTEAATDTGLEVPAVQSPESVDVTEPEPVEPDESEYDPVQDEEMPLADHIEEMIKRLAAVVVVAGAVSAAIFPFAEFIINHLWDAIIIGNETTRPRVYGPLALKLTELKAASIGGLILALPVAVYETYRFMRPGLYPNERRYYLAAVPTSLVLAFVGVSFAYFLVLPAIFTYFLYYSDDVAVIAFGLSKTFNLILLMMGYLALVFQIPLFIMLAIMMGLTTRQWLESRRLYFWGGFLGVSFMFGFDPTGMAPIMVAATMVVLFEGTLALLRWTGR